MPELSLHVTHCMMLYLSSGWPWNSSGHSLRPDEAGEVPEEGWELCALPKVTRPALVLRSSLPSVVSDPPPHGCQAQPGTLMASGLGATAGLRSSMLNLVTLGEQLC